MRAVSFAGVQNVADVTVAEYKALRAHDPLVSHLAYIHTDRTVKDKRLVLVRDRRAGPNRRSDVERRACHYNPGEAHVDWHSDRYRNPSQSEEFVVALPELPPLGPGEYTTFNTRMGLWTLRVADN